MDDLLEISGQSMIERAAESLICHIQVPLNNGLFDLGTIRRDSVIPLRVGLVILIHTIDSKTHIGTVLGRVISNLQFSGQISDSACICELHFKKDYSMEETIECFLYSVGNS